MNLSNKGEIKMFVWYVIDEFDFVFEGPFATFEEAEKSQKFAESSKLAQE